MPDLSAYKVDLDTPQPNGGRGESPRAAFTKYNGALDALENSVELDSNGQVPMAQLPVGSAGGLATLDQNSTLTATQMPASYVALLAAAFGYGQSLQNVTGSRAANVVYTNSTGRPIIAFVRADVTAASGYLAANVGGTFAGMSTYPTIGAAVGLTLSIPAGAIYFCDAPGATISSWVEYR